MADTNLGATVRAKVDPARPEIQGPRPVSFSDCGRPIDGPPPKIRASGDGFFEESVRPWRVMLGEYETRDRFAGPLTALIGATGATSCRPRWSIPFVCTRRGGERSGHDTPEDRSQA